MVPSAPDAWSSRVVATTFGPVSTQERSASGKRDSSAQRQTAQNRLQARNGLRGDRNASRKSPPIAGFLAVSGKSRGSKECVVADAVVIEPVSASQFPANREKNREFCNFGATSRIERPASPMISGLFLQIPYSAEQGISEKNREFQSPIRDFRRAIDWLSARPQLDHARSVANLARTVPRPSIFAVTSSPGATATIGPKAPVRTTSPAPSGRPRFAIVSASHTAAFSGLPRHAAPVPSGDDFAAPLHRHLAADQVDVRELLALEPRTYPPLDALSATVSANRMSHLAMRLSTISIAATT